MAIPNSIALNAVGIRQRFLRCSSTGQQVPIQSRRCWTRAVALAIIAGLAWGPTPTAQAESGNPFGFETQTHPLKMESCHPFDSDHLHSRH